MHTSRKCLDSVVILIALAVATCALAQANVAPTAPTQVMLNSATPSSTSQLIAFATGSIDDGGADFVYIYQWQVQVASIWTDGPTGRYLSSTLVRGDHWRCQARARDIGSLKSDWTTSVEAVVADGAPTRPASVTITPASPVDGDALTATVETCTDPDGDPVLYAFKWFRSVDGGVHWFQGPTSGPRATSTSDPVRASKTAVGEVWCCQAKATDGTKFGFSRNSANVTIAADASAALVATAAAAGTASGAAISVNLTAAADVRVSIVNLAGRVVAELGQSLPSGSSTLLWNGRSLSGTIVPSGRYFAQIAAKSAGGASASTSVAFSK